MKSFVQRVNASAGYEKIIEWGKLVTITTTVQIVIQVLGFVSGILVIRQLPAQEYAFYTIANSMLGTMTLIADGGVTAGVMSLGGKVWQSREKLGIVLSTGLDLRKKLSVGSVLIAIPVLLYLLGYHGASWLTSILILISISLAFLAALYGNLLEIVYKLRQDISPLQKIHLGANLGRFALLGFSLFVIPLAFFAVIASSIPQIWANRRLYKMSFGYADWNQAPDSRVRKDILFFVRRIFPGSIYYCLSGQILIWLVSFWGSTAAVAQVGALGRLAMLLGVFSVLFNTLVTPRYARLQDGRHLFYRYLQIQAGLLFFSLTIIGIVWVYPNEILWVLGQEYSSLEREVFLIITGSCLSLVAGTNFALCTSRGWIIKPYISIPIEIMALAVGAAIMDFTTLRGVLVFNIIFVSFIQVFMYGLFGFLNALKVKSRESHVKHALI